MAEFKRPESVLVVIYAGRFECLLLERVSPPGFWQSVTGTLGWRESPAEAAVREVREETGLVCIAPESCVTLNRTEEEAMGAGQARFECGRPAPVLVETGITRRFPIRPEWRDRYGPGVTENLEHLWYLELPEACDLMLDADEHVGYRWMGVEEAIGTVASWTNREALERLRDSGSDPQGAG